MAMLSQRSDRGTRCLDSSPFLVRKWCLLLPLDVISIQATRDDVKAEVMKAPKRRIDNVITRLTDSVHLLQVHTTVSLVCRPHRILFTTNAKIVLLIADRPNPSVEGKVKFSIGRFFL